MEDEDDELSLSRFVNQQPPSAGGHNSTIVVPDDGRSQPPPMERDSLAKLADVMATYAKGQSNTAAAMEKMTLILEDHKKMGTKRRNEEGDTDKIVMVEKTINVKDDGHETIDHKVGDMFNKL